MVHPWVTVTALDHVYRPDIRNEEMYVHFSLSVRKSLRLVLGSNAQRFPGKLHASQVQEAGATLQVMKARAGPCAG